MRLDLGAANAIQTYNTVRELQKIILGMRLVVPRWLREKSAFSDLDALHLPRPAVNKLSRLVPWAGWSYIERTLYSLMLVILLMIWRITGRGYRVLYVRDAVCAAWLCVFGWMHGAKVVYEVHDLEAAHPSKASKWPRPFWSRFLPWLDGVALRRACKLVSLTETFREWVVERGIRTLRDVAVIPDAFDPTLCYPGDALEARRALGLSLDAHITGYAGLTFAYRRLDLLVEAFAMAASDDPDSVLMLVGGRPDEVKELRELAGRLGIPAERLITPGQVGQAQSANYLRAADVLVIPDTVTGMTASPLKLFEYMAVGKPIVCKDMPALREIVDENCAIFFPEGDASALAGALRTLRKDAMLSKRLGEEVLRRSARYTYQARAERVAEAVKSCR
jgi:glycosyltransferase involved in cell wall biosynthesis